jgi:tetratricopeptide (TPR) repeat protein
MEGCIPAIITDVISGANRLPVLAAIAGLLLAGAPAADALPAAPADELVARAEQALAERDLPGAANAFTAAAEVSPDASVAERAAQFAVATGFDAVAERAVARWVALAPGNPLPRELLGRLKLSRYAVDEAAADLLAALGQGEPRRDEVYLALAADLAGEDDARMVTRVLARLTALDPLAPGLQLALGTAALRSGELDLALGAAETAALDDPAWPEPQLLIARILAASGRVDEGLARIAALRKDDASALIDLEYARLLADAGRPDEARAVLADLGRRFGDRPEINRTLAFLDLAAGDLDAADRRFDALDDAGADRFEAFYYRARIAGQRGDADAVRRFLGRITAGPYLVPAQLALAEALVRAGQGDEALAQLARFTEDHPAQAFQVLEFRAEVLKLLQRPDDAIAVYGEALEFKPASLRLLLARGALLEEQGRVGEALADLELAATLAPADAMAANAYGYILANRTGQARKAWPYVRRAWELQPGSAAIEDSVGWTLFKLGRREEARSHLAAALDRLPDPEIASHLAAVLWSLGDRAAARDVLRSAAVAFPDSRPVREAADRLRD